MKPGPRVLAVIPARGGSRGLPGKNIRPLAGLPLIAHSIRLARMCPEIARCVVSTDSAAIARVARRHGADVPFLRPARLARGSSPIWPVLKHALKAVEREEGAPYDLVLLLDPTSPTRLPSDVREAVARLAATPAAAGIVAVSAPSFSPIWHTVVDRKGWMADFLGGARYQRRQEVPEVYRINGLLYLWRASFVRTAPSWRVGGKLLMHVTPDSRAVSIDYLDQFKRTEALARAGLIELPWLDRKTARASKVK
jgi:N-acylneuraminate cytidylyltransferase